MEEDIMQQLRSITGETLSERFKDLNRITASLRSNAFPEDVILLAIRNYSPRDNFEKLVKIRLVNAFHASSEVVELIKGGDQFYIPWLVSFKWFFTDDCGLMNNMDQFVSEVLVKLSFSVRVKFLKRYGMFLKDHSKAEALYSVIVKRYGTQQGLSVLHACSANFVIKILDSNNLKMPDSICALLYKKYPFLVAKHLETVLEKMSQDPRSNYSVHSFGLVFKEMVSRDLVMFIRIYNKYARFIPTFELGRRVSRRLLKTYVRTVLKFPVEYMRLLKVKFLKSLSVEQVEVLHLGLLPKEYSEFIKNIRWYNKVNHMLVIQTLLHDPSDQERILVTNFEKLYGDSFDIKDLSQSVICMLPEEYRSRWARMMLEKNPEQLNYIAFLPLNDALTELKESIKSENDSTRRRIMIESMFQTLKINHDSSKLHEICDYVVKRHRNEVESVRSASLDELCEGFNLVTLKIEDWAPIIEMINIFIINDEIRSNSYSFCIVFKAWVHCRLLNNLDVDSQLELLLKYACNFDFRIAPNTSHEKYCLLWFLRKASEWDFEDKSMNAKGLLLNLLQAVKKWNKNHGKDKIEFPQWTFDRVKTVLESDSSSRYERDRFFELLTWEQKEQLYEMGLANYSCLHSLTRQLKKEPLKLVANLESVFDLSRNAWVRGQELTLFRRFSFYKNIGLPSKVVEFCLQSLSSDSTMERMNAINILSVLMETSDFLMATSKYFPDQSKIEDYSDQNHLVYSMQKEIAKCFKNLSEPGKLLSAVRLFAVGDYLKLVVGSLLSVFMKTPEETLLKIVIEWLDSPVSFRKHLIRAYCKVAPYEKSMALLTSLFTAEKNPSLRLIIFELVFGLFKSEPSEGTWCLLKGILGGVTEKKILTSLSQWSSSLSSVPQEFWADYMQSVWSLVRRSPHEDVKFECLKDLIISIDSRFIMILPKPFLDEIILCLYKSSHESFQSALNNFAVSYLLFSEDSEQTRRLRMVVDAIRNSPLYKTLILRLVSNLASTACTAELPQDPTKLLIYFNEEFVRLYSDHDALECRILLRLAINFLEIPPTNLPKFYPFLVKIGDLIDEYTEKYGGEMVLILEIVFPEVIQWLGPPEVKVQEALRALIGIRPTKACCLLTLRLIQSLYPSTPSGLAAFEREIQILASAPFPSVQILLNNFLYKENSPGFL